MCVVAGIAAVGAAGSIGGALISSDAAGSAAQTQADAATYAANLQQQQYADTVTREQPFVGAGTNALQQLLKGLGLQPGGTGVGPLNAPFDPSKLAQTPGYQFTKQQGEQALLDQASATGGIGGNQLKALMQYGQGLASTTYEQQLQDYLQQQQTQFNNLQTIAGSGQNAAANLGALGAQTATAVGNNLVGAANARSAGTIASANAFGGAVQGLGNNFLLSQLLSQGGGSLFGGGFGGAEPTTYGGLPGIY